MSCASAVWRMYWSCARRHHEAHVTCNHTKAFFAQKKTETVEWNALGTLESGVRLTYLGHDELVDDPALAVVDGDLVGGDGSGGGRRPGRLLQLRGARPRVPRRRSARARRRGAGAPPQARPPRRPDASPAATREDRRVQRTRPVNWEQRTVIIWGGRLAKTPTSPRSGGAEHESADRERECVQGAYAVVVAAGQAIVPAVGLVDGRVRPARRVRSAGTGGGVDVAGPAPTAEAGRELDECASASGAANYWLGADKLLRRRVAPVRAAERAAPRVWGRIASVGQPTCTGCGPLDLG
jgi:hypothetical protein